MIFNILSNWSINLFLGILLDNSLARYSGLKIYLTKGEINTMALNQFSPEMGIPIAAEMEASVTSNSKAPTLVFLPSKFNANCFATSGWPLSMFWQKERHHALRNISLAMGSVSKRHMFTGSVRTILPPLCAFFD
jgi:hypothetical protein